MHCRGRRFDTILLACTLGLVLPVAAQFGDSNSTKWDHLVFTQQWPESVCHDINNSTSYKHPGSFVYQKRVCTIHTQVHTWTVHGVWPSLTGTKDEPNCCNNTYKFQPTEIKDLEDQLNTYWPDLFATDESHYDFWKHEWVKHGTCALNFAPMKGEHRYFKSGLALNKQYDLTKILADSDITPSDSKKYTRSAITSAIKKALRVDPHLQCSTKKKSRVQYLEQIEICLDKSLKLIECPPRSHARSKTRSHNPCKKAEEGLLQHQMNHAGLLSDIVTLEPCDDKRQVMYPVIKHKGWTRSTDLL